MADDPFSRLLARKVKAQDPGLVKAKPAGPAAATRRKKSAAANPFGSTADNPFGGEDDAPQLMPDSASNPFDDAPQLMPNSAINPFDSAPALAPASNPFDSPSPMTTSSAKRDNPFDDAAEPPSQSANPFVPTATLPMTDPSSASPMLAAESASPASPVSPSTKAIGAPADVTADVRCLLAACVSGYTITKEGGSHVEFQVTTTAHLAGSSSGTSWTVQRRQHQFEKLHASLTQVSQCVRTLGGGSVLVLW